MMKKIIRLITAAVSCMIVMSVGMINVSAASDNSAIGFDGDTSMCLVYDEKGVFDNDPDTLDELNELVRDTAEELDLYIAIHLSSAPLSESAVQRLSDEAYEELFGADSDGIFYYMDLSEQYSAYDYISTSGKGMLLYDDHIDDMFDNIFRYLPSSGETIRADDIESGIRQICRELKTYDKVPGFFSYEHDTYNGKYIYYRDGKTVITSSKPAWLFILNGLLFGTPAGIIVGLMVYFITKRHYKFKESCNPQVYVSHEKTNFTQREDRFIRTYTTKTKIESSSSSGGRHSGGSHRSGSHGGGGRHR